MNELTYDRVQSHLARLKLPRMSERLDSLAEAAAKQDWTYLDFLDQLLQAEVSARSERDIAMKTKLAHFPFSKTLDQFDFGFQPSISERQIRELASLRFVANGENVLLLGPPGVGKPQPIHYPYRCDVHSGAIRYRRRSPSPALWPHAALGRHHAETLPWSLLRRLAPPRRRTSRAGQCD